MQYLLFSLLFVVIHMVAYMIAGAFAYRISADLYKGDTRLIDFVRDMDNERENNRVGLLVFPAQIVRALLMSIVLYPLIGLLGELSFSIRVLFLAGLMFIYTDFASAIPFPHNVEGYVYLKERYVNWDSFWKLQVEMALYSLLFGLASSWLLF